MKRRLTWSLLVVALVGGVSLGLRTWLAAESEKPFTVNTAAVSRGDVIDEVNATGTLQAVTTVQVGTEVSGIVAWLGADYNSVVKKGQVVARLDSRLMEVSVDRSRADVARTTAEAENARQKLRNAQLTRDRMQTLWEKQIIARDDYEAAVLAVSVAEQQEKSALALIGQAEATLKQNQVTLSHATITSPIDGIVVSRSVDVGQTVSASMSAPTIFTIANDLKEMQVKAGIDESDISRVRPDAHVTFGVDAYPGVKFEGTVKQVRLEPTVTQNVTTYSVIIDAPNPEFKLLPGMTANVGIEHAARYDVVRVPNAALHFHPTATTYRTLGQAVAEVPTDDGEGGYNGAVWTYANGTLTIVPVQVGISNAQMTELVAGNLEPGMQLVTGVTPKSATAAPAAPQNNIFMQQQGRGVRGRG